MMVLVGLFLAYVYPSLQNSTSDMEFNDLTTYQRGEAWKPYEVVLDKDSNPFQLRLIGRFLPGSPYLFNALSVQVSVNGPDGVVLDETIKLLPRSDAKKRADSQNDDGSVVLTSDTSTFSIAKKSNYIIKISVEGEMDFSLTSMGVMVFGKAIIPTTFSRKLGMTIAFFGLILIFRSRKKSHRKSVTETKPVPPVKKKIRWGRNADQD